MREDKQGDRHTGSRPGGAPSVRARVAVRYLSEGL